MFSHVSHSLFSSRSVLALFSRHSRCSQSVSSVNRSNTRNAWRPSEVKESGSRSSSLMQTNMHEGIVQVSTKIGKKKTMSSVTALTKSAAQALVHREERRVGSRMLAYEIVAQTVGSSSDWIRKFVNGYDGAKRPDVEVGFNLMTFYSRICERVERAGAKEQQLKEEIDAALESVALLVGEPEAADRGAEAPLGLD